MSLPPYLWKCLRLKLKTLGFLRCLIFGVSVQGTSRAFDSDVHQLRPHPGQINVARRLRLLIKVRKSFRLFIFKLFVYRSLLHSEAYPSAIAESHRFCDRVQDAYTLRCTPQVKKMTNSKVTISNYLLVRLRYTEFVTIPLNSFNES